MAIILEQDPEVFFLHGIVDIFLSREAALKVCTMAFSRGKIILGFEPFIHTGKVQPRWDIMWDESAENGLPPLEEIDNYNRKMAARIDALEPEVNAFVLISWPIDSDTSPFAPAEG